MESSNSGHKRSIRNLLVRPKKQVAMATTVMALTLAGGAIISTVVIFSVRQQVLSLLTDDNISTELAVQIFSKTYSNLALLAGVIFLLCLAFGILTILVNHRIYGPMVPIERHIQALLDRKYEHRITLRKTDDLQEIASLLNKLADQLEKKK